MDEGFREYLKDGGIRSRKLWITIATIVIISSLGVMWAVYNWQESLFNTIIRKILAFFINQDIRNFKSLSIYFNLIIFG